MFYVAEFLNQKAETVQPKTLSGYRNTLEFFSKLKIEHFNRSDFFSIVVKYANPNWTRRTLEQRLKILCVFGNWLCDNRITERRHRPKYQRKPIQRDTPSSDEIDSIFAAVRENYQSKTKGHRFVNHQRYLILQVIYETGCRISEAVGIYLEDVRIQSGNYFILIRGTKSEAAERAVQISKKLFDDLNDFRNLYELKGRLFSSLRGTQVDTSEFSKWLRKFCEDMKISCKIHPHLFRYLYIIESIKKGNDPFEIMVRLGHSDVSMTLYYFKQVRRLYPDIELDRSISILEKKKNLNAHIYNRR